MKAFTISPEAKAFAYSEPVSMACGFPALAELVKKRLQEEPGSGDLFLFVNQKRTYCKVLFYSKDGLCILAKKLDGPRTFGELDKEKLSLGELQQAIDQVVVHGGKKLRRLKAA